jgi:hypothetical protein
MCPSASYLFFLLVQRQTILLVNGEALQHNGLTKNLTMPPVNPLSHNAPYFFFFTCPTPDDFTRQWGSSAA